MKKALSVSLFALCCLFAFSGEAAAQTSSVAGEWVASMNTPGGARPFGLIFEIDGEKLTGTVKRTAGDVPLKGTIKGADISFSYTVNYNGRDLPLHFTGKVDGDTISGTVSFGGNAEDTWSARRASTAKPN